MYRPLEKSCPIVLYRPLERSCPIVLYRNNLVWFDTEIKPKHWRLIIKTHTWLIVVVSGKDINTQTLIALAVVNFENEGTEKRCSPTFFLEQIDSSRAHNAS